MTPKEIVAQRKVNAARRLQLVDKTVPELLAVFAGGEIKKAAAVFQERVEGVVVNDNYDITVAATAPQPNFSSLGIKATKISGGGLSKPDTYWVDVAQPAISQDVEGFKAKLVDAIINAPKSQIVR